MEFSEKHVTTYKPINDSITFTTLPNKYSGGCLIQSTESGILIQTPPIEIRRSFTGGGCLLQKKRLPNVENKCLTMIKCMENFDYQTFAKPPSSYLELPGNRRMLSSFKATKENNETMDTESRQRKMIKTNDYCNCDGTVNQNICQNHGRSTNTFDDHLQSNSELKSANNDMQIQMNVNMQLPVNLNECQTNITATTVMPCSPIVAIKSYIANKQERNEGIINWKETIEQQKQKKKKEKGKEVIIHSTRATCYINNHLVSHSCTNNNDNFINVPTIIHKPAIFQSAHYFNTQFADSETMGLSNNFNKNVIMQPDNLYCATENRIIATENDNDCNNNERKNGTPTISISYPWTMSSPWSLDTKLFNDIRLNKIRRLLQTCGWYHENINWKQSENLLKDTSIGRWLMRDSSDSRYIFAISVQTARGTTSVRVSYYLKHFQFDTEPGLELAIPTFDCPITMLEYYIEYSKKMDRREVWIDYSRQLYSQIYLTKPLVKEIKSLSHLARLVVNRNKLPTEHLPLLIRNYLAEYPYTF